MRRIEKIDEKHKEVLKKFFAVFGADEDSVRKFHPHPFNTETAENIASLSGKDLYFVTMADDEIVAYGMLRGWDDGYEIPSLGIAVVPGRQGQGLGTEMMHHLIAAARDKGAPAIMLNVYKWNPAHRLYERLGFIMEQSSRDPEELKGILKLS